MFHLSKINEKNLHNEVGRLQPSKKQHLVCGAIVLTWTFMLTYMTVMFTMTSDIVNGVCVLAVYDSDVQEKAMNLVNSLIGYMLPILMCVFCYARIVYKLKYKVNVLFSSLCYV